MKGFFVMVIFISSIANASVDYSLCLRGLDSPVREFLKLDDNNELNARGTIEQLVTPEIQRDAALFPVRNEALLQTRMLQIQRRGTENSTETYNITFTLNLNNQVSAVTVGTYIRSESSDGHPRGVRDYHIKKYTFGSRSPCQLERVEFQAQSSAKKTIYYKDTCDSLARFESSIRDFQRCMLMYRPECRNPGSPTGIHFPGYWSGNQTQATMDAEATQSLCKEMRTRLGLDVDSREQLRGRGGQP